MASADVQPSGGWAQPCLWAQGGFEGLQHPGTWPELAAVQHKPGLRDLSHVAPSTAWGRAAQSQPGRRPNCSHPPTQAGPCARAPRQPWPSPQGSWPSAVFARVRSLQGTVAVQGWQLDLGPSICSLAWGTHSPPHLPDPRSDLAGLPTQLRSSHAGAKAYSPSCCGWGCSLSNGLDLPAVQGSRPHAHPATPHPPISPRPPGPGSCFCSVIPVGPSQLSTGPAEPKAGASVALRDGSYPQPPATPPGRGGALQGLHVGPEWDCRRGGARRNR